MSTYRILPNGAGDRYFSQPYIKPTLTSLLTQEQQRLRIMGFPVEDYQKRIDAFKEALATGNGAIIRSPGLIDPSQITQVVDAVNGNGEVVEAAINGNGEVVAVKPKPPNIMPLVLAAGAALFFLM